MRADTWLDVWERHAALAVALRSQGRRASALVNANIAWWARMAYLALTDGPCVA